MNLFYRTAEETEISFFDNQNKEIYQAYIY